MKFVSGAYKAKRICKGEDASEFWGFPAKPAAEGKLFPTPGSLKINPLTNNSLKNK